MQSLTVKGLSDLPRATSLLLEQFEAQDRNPVVAFYGEMGAGKTTLIQEICRQRGVLDDEVNSPSFAIINEYATAEGDPIYHFDFYRIKDIEEAFDFGYEEYFFSGHLCLVEWPERIEELLPPEVVRVRLTILDPDTRRIDLESSTD